MPKPEPIVELGLLGFEIELRATHGYLWYRHQSGLGVYDNSFADARVQTANPSPYNVVPRRSHIPPSKQPKTKEELLALVCKLLAEEKFDG